MSGTPKASVSDTHKGMAAANASSPAALAVESIKVTFPLKKGKTKVALNDVTVSFAPNSLTAILGPSGSGASVGAAPSAPALTVPPRRQDHSPGHDCVRTESEQQAHH
jgi:ABC-type glutathione transport system ATPase component